MSEHKAAVRWRRTTEGFGYDEFNRDHVWSFGPGGEVKASAAPEFKGGGQTADPEQALVAALSSCHMLTFLAIASKKRLVVDSYEDEAVGVLEKNAEGRLAVTRVMLRPKVAFSGPAQPAAEEINKLHESAHRNCFIANSVKTEVTVG